MPTLTRCAPVSSCAGLAMGIIPQIRDVEVTGQRGLRHLVAKGWH
jgi:hypothetical protein